MALITPLSKSHACPDPAAYTYKASKDGRAFIHPESFMHWAQYLEETWGAINEKRKIIVENGVLVQSQADVDKIFEACVDEILSSGGYFSTLPRDAKITLSSGKEIMVPQEMHIFQDVISIRRMALDNHAVR
jgi:hypothetical protein